MLTALELCLDYPVLVALAVPATIVAVPALWFLSWVMGKVVGVLQLLAP